MASFVAVVSSIVFAIRKARQAAKEHARYVAENPGERWKWRPDWAEGRIDSTSTKTGGIALLVFAAIWNSMVFLFVYLAFSQMPKVPWPLVLVLALFVAVGVGIATSALILLLRWRRYGTSVLELETRPGVIGGRLAGRVWARIRPEPGVQISVQLKCLEQRTRQRSKGGSEKDVSVLWTETRTLRGEELSLAPDGGAFVPIDFVIPPECQETTSIYGDDGIYWELEVRAKLPGPDYVATFRVPVFVTEESDSPHAQQLQEKERRRTLAAGPPPKLSARISPTATGGTEIFWPPFRHVVGGAILLVLAALCGLGIYALPMKGGVWIAYLFLGLFGTLFGVAGMNAMFGSSRLQLEPEGTLILERKMLGLGRTRKYNAADIAVVERIVGSSTNQTSYFYLQLRTGAGEKLLLGSGMESEAEIAYLEAMVEDWLAQYQRRASYWSS